MTITAQIRHRHPAAPARVRATDVGRAEVEFEEPQSAITPGQAVVFYNGDVVVGGAWIGLRPVSSCQLPVQSRASVASKQGVRFFFELETGNWKLRI